MASTEWPLSAGTNIFDYNSLLNAYIFQKMISSKSLTLQYGLPGMQNREKTGIFSKKMSKNAIQVHWIVTVHEGHRN